MWVWWRSETQSTAIIVGVGLVVGAFFAYLVTIGEPYFWEIILPGSIVGLIVGFATAIPRTTTLKH